MNIKELKQKHFTLAKTRLANNNDHTIISIEFAISVLEDFYHNAIMDYEIYKEDVDSNDHVEEILEALENKIDELKTLINEKI